MITLRDRPRASIVIGLGAAMMIVLVGLLWLTGRSNEAGTVVAGTAEDLRSREVSYLPDRGIFVVATEVGFLALSDDARHVGERVLYCRDDKTFFSPAHGERFDRLGRYLAGPAQGDLGRYPVSVEDDLVVVDLAAGPDLPPRSAESLPSGAPACTGEGEEDPPGFYAEGAP
jgi:nitrite reductase/ring-hydroxylating ferredoxin subunit